MPDDHLSGSPLLLRCWQEWDGAVDCGWTERHWSAKELRQQSDSVARTLAELGIQPEERVGLMVSNTAAFPILLAALLEAECNPVLLHVGSKKAEVRHLVAEYGITRLLHDFLDSTSHLDRDGFSVEDAISVCDMPIALLSLPESQEEEARFNCGRGVVLHGTSGTYGASRFCIRNQEVAVAEARNYVDSITAYQQGRVRVTTPLSHAYAYGFGLMSALVTHSALVVDVGFNPRRILREEMEHPSTIMAIVPPMAKALAQEALGHSDHRISKHVFFAGAKCPDAVMEQFESTFQTPLYAIYGSTETGAIASSYSNEGRRPGVGLELDNVAVEITNCGHYASLGDGIGEVLVKSSSMMQRYLKGQTEPVPEFWSTGDIGFKDAQGNLTLVGRIRDIINMGGMKVDPSEVEKVLLEHPDVADAAVYPGLRPDGAEFVQAALHVRGQDVDISAIKQHCLTLLEGFKAPTRFHVVSEIPRSPSGKCLKIRCPEFPKEMIVGSN